MEKMTFQKDENTAEYLERLQKLDIFVRLDGDRLRVSLPDGDISIEAEEELVARKEELRSYLQEWEQAENQGLYPRSLTSRSVNLPLSFSQQRFWFLQQLDVDQTSYILPSILKLTGPLDIPALERSLQEIVRRHETLRTNYLVQDETPIQVIHEGVRVDLDIINLQEVPEDERERKAEELIWQQISCPFDLTKDVMLRGQLVKLQENEHILVITLHHIAADGWSLSVFSRELNHLYTAYRRGEKSQLPDLAFQYADYAVWQRDWIKGKRPKKQLAYWIDQLSGLETQDIPTDRPRPAILSNKGESEEVHLPADLVKQLHAFCKREGITLFMVLLAAYSLLLKRYSRQEDIAVGTLVANRHLPGTENMIGLFLNTLVMRTDLSGNPTFLELIKRVRDVALDAYENQDIPFEKLFQELQPERELSRTPFFQTLLNLQNQESNDLSLPEINTQWMSPRRDTSDLDFSLTLWEAEDGLRGRLEYKTDLFNASTIHRLITNLHTLLEAVVTNPEQKIDEISILNSSERQQILIDWNDTIRSVPQEVCLHDLFERQVAQTPQADALVIPDGDVISYEVLNRKANQLARYLQAHGLERGIVAGLALGRSSEMMVALLAILKAGGTYLPLDPDYPPERLAYMIEVTEPALIVTKEHLLGSLEKQIPAKTKMVFIDKDQQTIAALAEDNLGADVHPKDTAYIIFTSGSTGRPKGVRIKQESVVNFSLAAKELFEIQPWDRMWQFATINFDTAIEEIYPALFGGAAVVLRKTDAPWVGELVKVIDRDRLTMLDLPTAYWQEWVVYLHETEKALPESLRLVLVGGEKVDAYYYQLWQDIAGSEKVRWLNTYGASELTAISTVFEPPSGEHLDEIPIGHPLANTQAYILNNSLQPVPVGIPGDLYFGGLGLADGYVGDEKLTAERFIDNPFNKEMPGTTTKIYRTGDVAYFKESGEIIYIGRQDNQIKIRGYRVEPGEIEAVLRQHPLVHNALATLHENKTSTKQIVVYVVLHKGCEATSSDLRNYLKERLPDYMIPSIFIFLDSFPLNPSGKVDRKALPVPDITRAGLETMLVLPSTHTEKKIVEIWVEVLGIRKIGIHDNFFELGGHSLLATQVVTRLTPIFQLEIPVRMLFECPTISEMADYIDMVRETMNDLEVVSEITENDREDIEL
jgi:aspartate racemase